MRRRGASVPRSSLQTFAAPDRGRGPRRPAQKKWIKAGRGGTTGHETKAGGPKRVLVMRLPALAV